MRTLVRLVLVVAVVVGVWWLLGRPKSVELASRKARAEVDSALRGARQELREFDVPTIAEELKRTGRVVRRKTESAALKLGEATADARTTAAIKAKLALDPELSALDISVDTTDGRVTLAGRVDSVEDVARAIRLALEENNVREVVSTLQVVGRDEQAKLVTQIR
jgi:osmotically-inducible protein OsmY